MKEFIEKRYLDLERLAKFLDYGDLAEYSDVSKLLSSDKWEKHIDPIFDYVDDLAKVSNEILYKLACVIDEHFSTYCHYRLNKKFTSQEDRVLHLMGWIVEYCCDSTFEIDDCNDRWGE